MVDYIGRQFGNYQLTRLLGEGAFAYVYLGEHIYLGTPAAIKILSTQSESYPVDMFRTEARSIARLVHPNIVRVLEFGVEGKTPFLVLDYAPNGTLRQRHMYGTRVPLPIVVSYIKQVAEALQYAHDEKLIHRDVKPENILLGRRNEILLSDFGIALMVQTFRYQSVQNVAGTLPYMAPEQIQGQPRQASDQYSLGVLAYEWLGGTRPFDGSLSEILSQQLVIAAPSLRIKMPALSPAVDQVVQTALNKDPDKRFGSVRAFARALEQASQNGSFQSAVTVGDSTSGLSSSNEIVVPTANATYPASPLSLPSVQAKPVGTVICRYQGHFSSIRSLSWLPDSMGIISASSDNTVHVWDTTTGSNRRIYQDASGAVRVVTMSSDGSRVATVGGDALVRIWDFAADRLICVYHDHVGSTVNALAWSPKNYLLASASADSTVHVWDTTTGQPLTIYRGHTGSVNMLAWSPDEATSGFGRGQLIVSGGDDALVRTWEASTGKNIGFYRGQPVKILSVAWSPSIYTPPPGPDPSSSMRKSSRVACGRADGMVQMWDTSVDREVLNYRYSAPLTIVAWSPDGRRFAYASDDKTIQVWDTTTNLKLFTFAHTAPPSVMAWSPDGKYIASGGSDTTIQVWVAP
jgi:serine/threonine protein kinase